MYLNSGVWLGPNLSLIHGPSCQTLQGFLIQLVLILLPFYFDAVDSVGSHFCISHKSSAVVTCTQFLPNLIIMYQSRAKLLTGLLSWVHILFVKQVPALIKYVLEWLISPFQVPAMVVEDHYYQELFWLITSLIIRFMGPTWGPPGANRTQVGPMLAPWILLSGFGWILDKIFTDPRYSFPEVLYGWFNARLQYPKCVSNGVTSVLHWAIGMRTLWKWIYKI